MMNYLHISSNPFPIKGSLKLHYDQSRKQSRCHDSFCLMPCSVMDLHGTFFFSYARKVPGWRQCSSVKHQVQNLTHTSICAHTLIFFDNGKKNTGLCCPCKTIILKHNFGVAGLPLIPEIPCKSVSCRVISGAEIALQNNIEHQRLAVGIQSCVYHHSSVFCFIEHQHPSRSNVAALEAIIISASSRQSIVKQLYIASSNDTSSPFAQIQLFKWTAVVEQSSGAGLALKPCLLIWLTSCCILGSMHATPGLVPGPAGAREHEEAEVLAVTPGCQHLISFAVECFP